MIHQGTIERRRALRITLPPEVVEAAQELSRADRRSLSSLIELLVVREREKAMRRPVSAQEVAS